MIQINSKGYIKQNNNNHVEGIKWNADYDGNKANIRLDVNKNGHVERRDIQLHNTQLGTLAKLLSVPSVNKPLERRLLDDYDDEADYDEDDVIGDGNMFQNYISTPRRMRRRRSSPQIVRLKLEPMMEQEFPDVFQNEFEEEEEENDEYHDNNEEEREDDPRQEMMMMEQLLNETPPTPSSNRSHKKKPRYKKYPTHKVRFSPRDSSRTSSKRITLRGGRRKKRKTCRHLKR
jgi:hypothetical protein